ncbi:MAG: PilZ domain-containing protein, partial [Deltaproteobacteria bacterium]|nr:PilZ domain-containing protein [Deltaproteobacteria bacterium]
QSAPVHLEDTIPEKTSHTDEKQRMRALDIAEEFKVLDKQSVLGQKNFTDRRKFQRKEKKLKIIIIAGGKTFRTYSKNISQGGILLEKAPSWDIKHDTQPCTIYLSNTNQDETICLQAHLIRNHNSSVFDRLQFIDATQAKLDQITDLLQEQKNALVA